MTSPVSRVLGRAVPESTRARHAILAVVTAVTIWLISTGIFPHHSTNHDEAVYLQQAAMLLDGQLFLNPPVEDAFRPWFFVESNRGLYPKYMPPTAATFAVGKLLGGYRIALALVAAGCTVLTQVTVAEAFDDRTGWVAAAVLLASPLFLVQASVFLPYVPALFWSLAFAAAYLHADRTASRGYAALAGLAIAVAFFSRPYTAVLFAAPFVAHALWTLRTLSRETFFRHAITAAVGLLGPVAALSYNAYVTGDPLLFPYEAFAPLDGLGLGRRELLGYTREYTPRLAARTTVDVLWILSTRWLAGGLVGAVLAIGGFAVALRRGLDARQAAIAGLVPSLVLGNAYFWGSLNLLGELGVGGDGHVATLGPYYHVALLLPASAFVAVGLLAGVSWIRTAVDGRFDSRHAHRAGIAVLVVLAGVLGAAGVVATGVPLAHNAQVSDQLDAAYEPFEDESYDDAVVFLPTPHGDWLLHPFQELRNDPDFEEGGVFALRENQFAVVDAFPDREYHRYTYRGQWTPTVGDPVQPHVQRVHVTAGETVDHRFTFGVPDHADSVSFRLSSDDDRVYDSTRLSGHATVESTVTVTADGATLATGGTTKELATNDTESLELHAFVDYGTGAGYAYRADLPIEHDTDTVRTLTPYVEVCTDAFTCDGEAAYVPGAHAEHVSVLHESSANS